MRAADARAIGVRDAALAAAWHLTRAGGDPLLGTHPETSLYRSLTTRCSPSLGGGRQPRLRGPVGYLKAAHTLSPGC